MNRSSVIVGLSALCFLLLIIIFANVQPTAQYVDNFVQVLQPKSETLQGLKYFLKFDRHIPPDKDVNCVNTIPDVLVEASKETPIIIPKKEILLKFDINVLTCLYHRYLQTFQRHCTQPTRVGNLGKGGWNVCTDPGAIPKQPCRVYSFSDVRDYGSFAKEMVESYKCQVQFYNPKKPKENFDNLKYHAEKLDVENGVNIANLSKTIEGRSKTEGNINVVTLDLNNREWEVIPKLIQSGVLKNVEQLSMRVHGTSDTSTEQNYIDRLLVLREMYNAGFRIFWSDRDETCLHKKRKVTACYYINMIRVMNIPSPVVVPEDTVFNNMKGSDYGELFVRYVTSVQIPCKEIVRIGKIKDGGWDVCHDALFRPRKSCLVYSFGINNDFSFDDDVARTYGCEVKSFDPSMGKGDHRHSPNVMFYATGISNQNGKVQKKVRGRQQTWKMRDLKIIKEELGHTKRQIDILKMDVEASEWGAIPNMITTGVLRNVTQFSFELHTGHVEDNGAIYPKALKMLRDLYDIGFRVFYAHRNLHCTFRTKTGKERTQCYEVYTANINTKLK